MRGAGWVSISPMGATYTECVSGAGFGSGL